MPSKRPSQIRTDTHDLACGICGKAIGNEISIKRHERYCRKRLACPPPPRRKSCIPCIRAKCRCDSGTPACGPCQQKERSCTYSGDSLPLRKLQPGLSSLKQHSLTAPAAVPISQRDGPQSTPLNSGMLITFEAALDSVPGLSSSFSSDLSESSSVESGTETKAALRRSEMPFTLRPLEPSPPLSSHLLLPKKRQPARVELISKLVSQIICSYPERRMNADSCPPFIHHSTFQRISKATNSQDPMFICQEITRKFAARKTRGDISIWEAVASEQERIYDQRGSLDKWLHLSSAQAVTIYLLMLAAEGESIVAHHPNISIALLFTLGSNFAFLNKICPVSREPRKQNTHRQTWEDWIFAESKLRTATVYFILALHFDVNFGLPCEREGDHELKDLDLPAAKSLWEAKSEPSWCQAIDLVAKARYNFNSFNNCESRLRYGDLVRFNRQDCGYEDSDGPENASRLADRIGNW